MLNFLFKIFTYLKRREGVRKGGRGGESRGGRKNKQAQEIFNLMVSFPDGCNDQGAEPGQSQESSSPSRPLADMVSETQIFE